MQLVNWSSQCDITNVVDGRTIDVRIDTGSEERVRLLDVWAPEMETPEGPRVKAFVQQWVQTRKLYTMPVKLARFPFTITAIKQDSSGRYIGIVYDLRGVTLNDDITHYVTTMLLQQP